MNAVSTKNAEWYGNELFVEENNFDLPNGWTAPKNLSLCSVHVRHRGVYLGRSWYLQSVDFKSPKSTIDVISFVGEDYGNAKLERAQSFLAHHGYRCVDEHCGEYQKVEATVETPN